MTEQKNRPKPVVLCILDGWGERAETENNAIALGDTPNWDDFVAHSPKATLDASALDVGLPEGQMGNSEVGHTNLGAGRVVMQDLPRIDAAIADGSLKDNASFREFIGHLKESGGVCHLMGLLSPGGVHSHQDHLAALAGYLAAEGIPVAIHAFLDGRDTPPSSGKGYMETFLSQTRDLSGVSVRTVSGRYYAMDRDNRWDRVEKAYDALVEGRGESGKDPVSAISASYEKGETDEFMLPTTINGYQGMQDGDALLMANFRADRAREILDALAVPGFDGFQRSRTVTFAARAGLVRYSRDLDSYFMTLFPANELNNILGEVVSLAGMKQLRIAETEKYAHVTFFFNGGRERVFEGEERILVPSPKVATYDLQPEMSAIKVTDNLIEAIRDDRFDLIIVNYANGDMVGHTGILSAAKKATATVDTCIGRLNDAVIRVGGVLLITADHGNCEQMLDNTGEVPQPHTAHTMNKVPLLLRNAPEGVTGLKDGTLADIAPTLLDLLGIEQPLEMTGQCLMETSGKDV